MHTADRQSFIEGELLARYRFWFGRATLWGAVMFVALIPLDFIAAPHLLQSFLIIRLLSAGALLGLNAVSRRLAGASPNRHFALGYLAVFISAAAVEFMILRFGAHASPYYVGLILVGLCVTGFLPAPTFFHATSLGIIMLTYLVPLALVEYMRWPRMFLISNVFMLAFFATLLYIRHVTQRTIERELSLSHELRHSESRFRDLFVHAVDPIFMVDHTLRYTDVNPRATEVFGYTRDEYLRMSILDVIPEEQIEDSAKAFDLLFQEGYYQEFEGRMRRRDGQWRDIQVSASAIVEGGRIVGSRDIVRDITERKSMERELRRSRDELEKRVQERTAELIMINKELAQEMTERQQAQDELSRAYDATIEGLALALETRDHETQGHCRRVTDATVALARHFNMPEDRIVHIRRGALLHDIGKLGVPDRILLKEGPLTDEEMALMRRHPGIAYDMFQSIPFLMRAVDIPYGHHEKWDGTGYPLGLKGTDIPLAARIFAIVDVWDALGSDRPYRKAWDPERIIRHIESLAGTHFDPAVVAAFRTVVLQDLWATSNLSGEVRA